MQCGLVSFQIAQNLAAPDPPRPRVRVQDGVIYHHQPADSDSSTEANRDQRERSKYGNFTPICNGLFVLSPSPANFAICLLALIVMQLNFFCQLRIIYKLDGTIVGNLGIVLYILTIGFFIWTCITDPGVIPNDLTAPQYLLLCPKSNDEAGFSRHDCSKCNKSRPPRAFHCSICGTCIRRQDMHMTLGGICIGQRNFIPYIFLNLFSVALGIYLLTVNSMLLSQTTLAEIKLKYPEDFKGNVLNAVLSAAFGMLLLCLPQTGLLVLLYRCYLISQNKTVREDYMRFKGYDIRYLTMPGFERSFWSNWMCFFCPTPKAKSVFRSISKSAFACSGRSWENIQGLARRFSGNNNSTSETPVPHNLQDITINSYLLRGARHVIISERRYATTNGISTAKLTTSSSVPYMEDGELDLYPGTRIQIACKGKPVDSIRTKIKLFRQMQQSPKSTVDYHKTHSVPASLSEGAIPRTEQTTSNQNELIQLTRARQIQLIIELMMKRDRAGLVEMARHVNIGALVGINNLDPDNLQIIELHDGMPLLFASRDDESTIIDLMRRQQEILRNRRLRLNQHWLGLPQMVAAGLLEQNQYRTLRRLTGETLFV